MYNLYKHLIRIFKVSLYGMRLGAHSTVKVQPRKLSLSNKCYEEKNITYSVNPIIIPNDRK